MCIRVLIVRDKENVTVKKIAMREWIAVQLMTYLAMSFPYRGPLLVHLGPMVKSKK